MEREVKREKTKTYSFEDGARRIGISTFYSRILNREITVLASETKKGAPVTVFGEAVSFRQPLPSKDKDLEENQWQLKVVHSPQESYYCVYIQLPDLVVREAEKILRMRSETTDLGSR
ncbi:MAG: hypothetical protein QW275_02550 [Candidatus Anstonellaceae archaeon]